MSTRAIVCSLGGLIAAAVVAYVVMRGLITRVPPDTLTKMTMEAIQERLQAYYLSTGQLPHTLSDLPPGNPARLSATVDAWGRSIGYKQKGKLVVLYSLRRDGKAGGNGADQDVFLVFDPSEAGVAGRFLSSDPGAQSGDSDVGLR